MLVNVLWTGGFDSSFRMVQLSKEDVVIQPYYLSDNRSSEINELRAIEQITSDILSNPDTKSKILPLKVYSVSEVKENQEITKAYLNLRKIVKVGTQFEWLTRFAVEHQIEGLELSIEKSGTALVRQLFNQLGVKMELINKGGISYFKVSGVSNSSDVYKVFGHYHFPVWELTKLDMLSEYERLGFQEVIYKTWFCHRPIRNKACGYCNPCDTTIASGMPFRLNKMGLIRNKLRLFYINKDRVSFYAKKLVKR